MPSESFEGALQFYLRTKKMESAEDLNLFKFNENFSWEEFGNLHKLLVPLHPEGAYAYTPSFKEGVYASVEDSTDTSMHETENHIGKNTLVASTDDKNTLNKVETVPCSPLKSRSSSPRHRLWSHASSGIGSGSLSPSDPLNISSISALPSKNTRGSAICINDCNVDRDIITLRSKNSCSLVNGSVSGSNDPFFLPDTVCSSVTDFSFSENECHDRKDDLMDYDWADIGNLEDIDGILRNLCSGGQRHGGGADELSWFSTSSENLYDSGITLESGLQSTCTEMTELNNTWELHGGSAFSGNCTSTISHQVSSNNGCQVSFEKCEPQPNEQVYVEPHETCQEILNENIMENRPCIYEIPDMVEKQYSAEEKRIDLLEFYKPMLSNVSNSGSCSSNKFSKQDQDVFKKMHVLNPCVKEDSSIPMLESSFRKPEAAVIRSYSYQSSTCRDPLCETSHDTQYMNMLPVQLPRSLSIPEKNIEKLFQDSASVLIENSDQHYNQASRASVQKNNACHLEKEIRNGQENITLDNSNGRNDFSISMDTSFLNTDVSESLIRETSFKKFQYALDQLDARTKLCMRDGLYRLARNAKQRHDISHENTSSRENNFKRTAPSTEPSEISGRGDLETVTNPIDRSIAHLLFHKPLKYSSKFKK